MKNVHEKMDLTDFECEFCNRKYQSLKARRTHIREVHESLKHQCLICFQDHIRKRDLDIHVRTVHYKIKTQECELCKKSFSQWNGLNCHLKSKAHIALLKSIDKEKV